MGKFSKQQLDIMRKAYGTLSGMNPSSPTYKKFIKFLDKLPKDQLKQLAGANIKFVSMLAKNRLRGESVNEGKFGKFDTGAAFKGNGLTVYDRNQEKAGDYKDIAHIGEDGKITIWDKNIKKEPKLMKTLMGISKQFKDTFKESVNEAKFDSTGVDWSGDMMWKWVSKALKTAGIKELKYTPMKSGWLGSKFVWGGFYKVQANKRTDVLPITVDKKGKLWLNVSPKKYIIGKIGQLPQVIYNLKDFKKSDLDVYESVNEASFRWPKMILNHIKDIEKYKIRFLKNAVKDENWLGEHGVDDWARTLESMAQSLQKMAKKAWDEKEKSLGR